jgi:hypothetical protein
MPSGQYVRTEEHRKLLAEKVRKTKPRLGKKLNPEQRKKLSILWRGRPKLWLRGRKFPGRIHSRTFSKGITPWNKGKYHRRISGSNHWNWRGGITSPNERLRHSLEYKLWRIAVFERDNYTCLFCGTRGGDLQADHIRPFSLFPELRFAIDNGRTLCITCHRNTSTWGNHKTTIKKYGKQK